MKLVTVRGTRLFNINRGTFFDWIVNDQTISPHPCINDQLYHPTRVVISHSFREIKEIFTNETFRFTITRAIPFIHKDGTRGRK